MICVDSRFNIKKFAFFDAYTILFMSTCDGVTYCSATNNQVLMIKNSVIINIIKNICIAVPTVYMPIHVFNKKFLLVGCSADYTIHVYYLNGTHTGKTLQYWNPSGKLALYFYLIWVINYFKIFSIFQVSWYYFRSINKQNHNRTFRWL